MPEPEEQQEEEPAASPATPKKVSNWPVYILAAMPGLLPGLILVVGIAIAVAILGGRMREPAPHFDASSEITGPLTFPENIDETAAATCLDGFIAKARPTSPLRGKGKNFVEAGKANDINPTLMISMAVAESGLGTDNGPSRYANYFGLTTTKNDPDPDVETNGRFKKFLDAEKKPDWDGAILYHAKYLKNHYFDEGKSTLSSIQQKYSPVGASNDPKNKNSAWLTNVTKSINAISQICPTVAIQSSNNIITTDLASVPYLSQGDPKWNIPNFDDAAKYFPKAKSFRGAGCGATSAAMVASYLTKKEVTPIVTAESFYQCNSKKWAPFSPSCVGFNIKGNKIPFKDVTKELNAKHPIIMRIEPHTGGAYEGQHAGGHYVVIKDIKGSNFVTNDPSGDKDQLYSTDASKYLGGWAFFAFSN